MRRYMVVIALSVGLVACGGGDDGSTDQPGSPEVYARIAAETDCQILQDEFDRAADNFDRAVAADEPAGEGTEREWTVAYMKAADERMAAIGCYD